MSDDRSVRACPHCDCSRIRYQTSQGNWYCRCCNRVFDEPTRRPPKDKGGGSVAEYADLNKSDLELFNDA